MHLSAANLGLPSSGISVQMLAASAIVPDVNTAVVAGSDGCGRRLGKAQSHCSHAGCQPGLAALPGASAVGLGAIT